MQQVILNLVMNARDAMAQGGQIRISTGACTLNARSVSRHPGLHAGDYVILAVSDNGCGMDEEVRAHLFEPFFTTKRTGQGVRLGMAMIYGIVTQSGGAVSVTSKPGMGTRVTIHLPRHASPTSSTQGRSQSADTPTGSETILLVEDDHGGALLDGPSAHRIRLSRAARRATATRRSASPAPTAAEIDLLISDIVLPGMCGNEVAVSPAKVAPRNQGPVHLRVSGPGPCGPRPAPSLLYKPFSPRARGEGTRVPRSSPGGSPRSPRRRTQRAKGKLSCISAMDVTDRAAGKFPAPTCSTPPAGGGSDERAVPRGLPRSSAGHGFNTLVAESAEHAYKCSKRSRSTSCCLI